MAPTWTQDDRAIAINSPLGKDVLLLKGFKLVEEMGRPFICHLDLRSQTADIDFSKIIGENVTIRVNLTSGETRYINGYISRFSQEDVPVEGAANKYRATVVPWLWFLTRTTDCKIFQNMNIPDIVKKVFDDAGFNDYELGLSGTYNEKEYVVQYRETAFNFVSRLLEYEGIYYFFKHEDGKHTLVLADSPSAHEPAAGYDEVKYLANTGTGAAFERVWEWECEKRLQPGKTSLTDFDFKAPSKNLYSEKADPKDHAHADFEVFDFPGLYAEPADGTTYAAVRNEEIASQFQIARAQGDVRGVFAGAKYKLTDYGREDQNADYVCLSAQCIASVDDFDTGGEGAGEEVFKITMTSIPAAQQFRPARTTPCPRVGGPQTAIVTGAEGDEIFTDEYGRVKVQFHWDRYGKGNDTSSCWIRVSHAWAGKKWGAIFLPRVGQEVIVDFLEGDPDRPIITGRVYNQECMPPYVLPDNKTIGGYKTLSSKTGEGFNELHFEDKKGEEKLFMHAEKDMHTRVKNDYFLTVVHDRNEVIENDNIVHVQHDTNVLIDNDLKQKVTNDCNITVGGKHAEKVSGSYSLTVEGDVIEVFQGDHSETTSGQLSVKADTIVLEGATNVTLKVGSSSIAIDSSSINIKTTTLTMNADGDLTAEAGGDLTAKAKANADFEGTGDCIVKAGNQLTCEGGSIAMFKAGGVAQIQGATIKIG